jgi:hypothetical protein
VTYALERAMDELILRGKREGKREVALAMIADGMPLESAAKYSGIPAGELAELIKPASSQ